MVKKQSSLPEKFAKWIKKQKASLARRKFRNPAKSLKIIGVAGSRGKTTVAHIMYHIFAVSGIHVGMISSEGIYVNGKEANREFSVNVTNPKELSAALSLMRAEEVQIVILETPTDMIREHVFDGIKFDSTVVTNLAGGEFIMNYGNSQSAYAEVSFFPVVNTVEEGLVVVNADDDSASWIKRRSEYLPQKLYAAWISREQVTDFEETLTGMSFSFEGGFFDTAMITKVNLENLLMAIRCTMKYLGVDQIDKAVNSFKGMPGRLFVLQYEPFSIVIDYEYMPMVLDRVYYNLNELKPEQGKFISVIGAAGNRGSLRKQVLRVAAQYSKLAIVVALDPRHESVAKINNDLMKAAEDTGVVLVERFTDHAEYVEADKAALLDRIQRVIDNGDIPAVMFDSDSPSSRHDGMHLAMLAAQQSDMIVVSGKGDDEVLDFGNTVYEWNDTRVVHELLGG